MGGRRVALSWSGSVGRLSRRQATRRQRRQVGLCITARRFHRRNNIAKKPCHPEIPSLLALPAWLGTPPLPNVLCRPVLPNLIHGFEAASTASALTDLPGSTLETLTLTRCTVFGLSSWETALVSKLPSRPSTHPGSSLELGFSDLRQRNLGSTPPVVESSRFETDGELCTALRLYQLLVVRSDPVALDELFPFSVPAEHARFLSRHRLLVICTEVKGCTVSLSSE